MKICLIRCPSPFLIDDMMLPPLGLMAVGTGLKAMGHSVTIHDGHFDDIPLTFQYYGLGPTTPEYPYALSVKAMLNEKHPYGKVIIGGPHATINPKVCVKDGFDCVVIGDGELVAEQAFCHGNPQIIVGEERPLDEYPIIDRSLVDIKKYHYAIDGQPATTLITSRGCPFHCGFCVKNHKTVRFRSTKKVIEEIKELHFDFGYNAMAFPEDIFILNKNRTETICQCLKELGIIWRCLVRADLVVNYGGAFLKMMAESGCIDISIGVESGSDKILSSINKGESVKTIKTAIRMIQNEGIRVKGFFIVGLPGESQDTLDETRRFLEEMRMDSADFKMFQPFPGSPIWKHRDRYDIEWDDQDYEDMFYKGRLGDYRGSIRTSGLTTEQIVNAWIELEATYKHAS